MTSLFSSTFFLVERKWFLLFVSFLTPILFFIYTTLVEHRPYYILETDIANDFYYTARLLHAGQPLWSTWHPGTPIQYLGYLILHFSGTDIESTQRFFNISSFVVSLFTALSICAFTHMMLKNAPIYLFAMTLVSIIAWPPFLTYMDYFGSDSFIVAFGLPTIAIFWKSLESRKEPNKSKLFLCGFGLGACLATKFSFLPVAIALLFAGTNSVLRSILSGMQDKKKASRYWLAKSLVSVLILPISVGVSFLIFTAPLFGRFSSTLFHLFASDRLSARTLKAIGEFHEIFGVPFVVIFPLFILIIIVLMVCVNLLVANTDGSKASGRSGSDQSRAVREFDYISGGIFLSCMLFAFMYLTTTYVTVGSRDLGISLRNLSPCALSIPFFILYWYRMSYDRGLLTRINTTKSQVWLIIASALVAVFSIGVHLDRRHELIENHQRRSKGTIEKFQTLSLPDNRIAFWDGSPGDLLGEAAFHFWGNYRYAANYFDHLLLERYPKYTFFRLREINRLVQKNIKGSEATKKAKFLESLRDLERRILQWWPQVFPNPYKSKTREIVTGEGFGVKVSTIAFPQDEGKHELRGTTLQELLSLIQYRLGSPSVREQSIHGIDWILVDIER